MAVLPCINGCPVLSVTGMRDTFSVYAVQELKICLDLVGLHKMIDTTNIAGVPLYRCLSSGTAGHLKNG
ncbi:hypothetical protein, partial [uncultured Bilophila sp.]|uniref:hypothetical protein n=1 Tax=uncultured Bilophila sp. TaxID=529385 RepID=UPI0026379F47